MVCDSGHPCSNGERALNLIRHYFEIASGIHIEGRLSKRNSVLALSQLVKQEGNNGNVWRRITLHVRCR
jgi:hypothetical protein